MKKILILVALMFSSPLFATDVDSKEPIASDRDEACMLMGLNAAIAMDGRQKRGKKTDLLDRLENIADVSEVGKSMYKSLIDLAYTWPVKKTQAEKEKSISSFQQAIYEGCAGK